MQRLSQTLHFTLFAGSFFLSLDSESVQFFAISLGMMNLRPAEQKSPAGRAVISASRQTSLLSSLCL